jgi:hypothetical protein
MKEQWEIEEQERNIKIYEETKNNIVWDKLDLYHGTFSSIYQKFKATTTMRTDSKMYKLVEKRKFKRIGQARFLELQRKRTEKELLRRKIYLQRNGNLEQRLEVERALNLNKLGTEQDKILLRHDVEKTSKVLVIPFELRVFLEHQEQEITVREFKELNQIFEEFRDRVRQEIPENIKILKENYNLSEPTKTGLRILEKKAREEYSWFRLLGQIEAVGYNRLIGLLTLEQLQDDVTTKTKLGKILISLTVNDKLGLSGDSKVIKRLEEEHIGYIAENYRKFKALQEKIELNKTRAKLPAKKQYYEKQQEELRELFKLYENNLNEQGETFFVNSIVKIEEKIETIYQKRNRTREEKIYETILELNAMDQGILKKYTNKITNKAGENIVNECLIDYFGEIQINRYTLNLLKIRLRSERKLNEELEEYIDNMIDYKILEEKATLLIALEPAKTTRQQETMKYQYVKNKINLINFDTIRENIKYFIERDKYHTHYMIQPKNVARVLWTIAVDGDVEEIPEYKGILFDKITARQEEKYFEWIARESQFKKKYTLYHKERRAFMGTFLEQKILDKTYVEIKYLNTDIVVVKMENLYAKAFYKEFDAKKYNITKI